MNRTEILARLQDIFADLLDDKSFILAEEASMDTVPEWDSLLHITLIMSVENEFQIKIATEDIMKVRTVEALIGVIEEKLRK